MTKHYYEIKNFANIGVAFDINAYTALVVDLVENGCEVVPDTAVKVLNNYQIGFKGVHQPTEDRLKAEAEERAVQAAEEAKEAEQESEQESVEEEEVEESTEAPDEQEQEDVEASKAAGDLASSAGLDINEIGKALGKSKLTKPDVQEYIDSLSE